MLKKNVASDLIEGKSDSPMVDISHMNDASVEDVLTVTKAPIIASHSCARAICDHPRNLNDDLLQEVEKIAGL
ncbi:MAG: membrane dipeptidase [Candidatus Marinimicrobia bacterium]|nr:membrane dipeptidase [Candidatus Neomarinimicrobiota bacterium]